MTRRSDSGASTLSERLAPAAAAWACVAALGGCGVMVQATDAGSEASADAPASDTGSSPIDAGDRTDASVGVDTVAADAPDADEPDATADDGAVAVDASSDARVTTTVCPATYPRFDLRADFGAVGDGTTDDTTAWQRAATAINSAHGGELTVPPGMYRVGREHTRAPGQTGPYYTMELFFSVHDLNCLRVSGYGATMKLAPGFHYGAFDPMNGQPLGMQTTSRDARAAIGRMIEIETSSNVLVEGLEVDGSSASLVLGGGFGNVDRQAAATGVFFNRSSDVTVRDVHTHHHALDGIAVEYQGGPPPRRMPHLLDHVNSEFNGRQGMSWIGGWGLEARDCQFNHTGRTINHGGGVDDGQPLASLPRAGVDIEPNGGTTERSREGVFTRCEFVDNAGPGMDAAAGDGGYSTFTDCTFWGTTSWSVWPNRPGLRFVNSRFYGSAVHASDGHTDPDPTPVAALATVFEGCTFEDRPWTDGRVFRANELYQISGGAEGATWRNCTFIAHELRTVTMGDATNHEIFEGCTFEHGDAAAGAGSAQASFQGSRITSCHFTESAAVASGSRNYAIGVTSVTVGTPAAGANATVVDGPHVHWDSSTGRIGTIPPGMY